MRVDLRSVHDQDDCIIEIHDAVDIGPGTCDCWFPEDFDLAGLMVDVRGFFPEVGLIEYDFEGYRLRLTITHRPTCQ